MNVIIYRLLKVVNNTSSNIDAILDNSVYREDIGNHIKKNLRNELLTIRECSHRYTDNKLSATQLHENFAYSRLRLAKILDTLSDMELFDDRNLLLTNNVYDSLVTLRQMLYVVMTQIAMTEI